MDASVIVGVDGSPSAAQAAELAGELAVRHRLPLEVVHAYRFPVLYPPFLPPSVVVGLDPRKIAAEVVNRTAAAVGERFPDLFIETHIVDSGAAGALVDASRHAAFLVVGHRGLGGFSELLIGSVGVQATLHAHCPVVVVGGDVGVHDAPVVVGVDGSKSACTALAFGLDEARARRSDLYAVLARPSAAGQLPVPEGDDPVDVDIVGDHPNVKIHREIRAGDSPVRVLSTLAREVDAGLIVVGSRGIGGFRGLLVGSTSRGLVDHAPCPVMVVPADAVARFPERGTT